MKILFCGSFLAEEYEESLAEISLAGNRYQNNFICTLEKLGHVVDRISFIGFPVTNECIKNNPSIHFKSKNIFHALFSFTRELEKKIENNDIVVVYNVIYAWLLLPILAKKKNKKSYLIQADYAPADSYNSIVKKIYSIMISKSIRKYDVVLAMSVNDKNMLNKKQVFCLMEGGIDGATFKDVQPPDISTKRPLRIMYAGLFNQGAGIDLFLESIKRIERSDICVYVSGQGKLEEYVKNAAQSDCRISYLGKLPYEKYLSYLKTCDILVNPRNMNLPENKHNFPSKMMEYIATGRMIVSTKFAGWEKFEKVARFCDCNVEELAKAIDLTCKEYSDNCIEQYYFNRKFAEKFDWKTQLKNIFDDDTI